MEGLLVQDSLPVELLCCVLEKATFIRYLVLVQPTKTGNCPDMTEKLLTGLSGPEGPIWSFSQDRSFYW